MVSHEGDAFVGFVLIFFVAVIYFIPSMVASGRKGSGGPVVINIFLGWTFLGWVAALAWAFSLDKKEQK